jgi:hypothetical protein
MVSSLSETVVAWLQWFYVGIFAAMVLETSHA